jgi:hypothetical protein
MQRMPTQIRLINDVHLNSDMKNITRQKYNSKYAHIYASQETHGTIDQTLVILHNGKKSRLASFVARQQL